MKNNDVIDSRGYLVAPLLSPTLHVFLAPVWAVASGRAELALAVMAWQAVAWLLLAAICLATMSPLLWIARVFVFRLTIAPLAAWAFAVLFAIVASFALLGPVPAVRSPIFSWIAAFTAACFAFAVMRTRESVGSGHPK